MDYDSYKYSFQSWWTPDRFLGSGSFGQVFTGKRFNPENGNEQEIAIKRALKEHSSSLEKEERILSALSQSPEIIDCYGGETSIEEYGAFYNLYLEYAPAGSLKDLITKPGLPDRQVRAYTRMILKALRCLHDKSYVHCDVKPDNILAFPSSTECGYRLKLADFGLAKEPDEKVIPGRFRGTPAFMGPESKKKDGEIGAAWDIWSLGCTVVVMATGDSVSHGRAKVEAIMPEEGRDFLSKCFHEDPSKRWSANMLLNHPYVSPWPRPRPPNPLFLLPHQMFAANKNCNQPYKPRFLLPHQMFASNNNRSGNGSVVPV